MEQEKINAAYSKWAHENNGGTLTGRDFDLFKAGVKLMDEQVIATAKCRQVPVLEDNGEVDMYRYLDQADVLSGINKLVAKIREMES